MGCCCSDILIYDINNDTKTHVLVAEIKGKHTVEYLCKISGATSLYRLIDAPEKKSGKIKRGPEINGEVQPPVSLIRKVESTRRHKIECPFCRGVFVSSMEMKNHLTICVMHMNGRAISIR